MPMAPNWLPSAELTASGRPIFLPGEVERSLLSSIDLESEENPSRPILRSGVLVLSSHRLLWIDPSSSVAHAIPLSSVIHAYPPKKSIRGMFASPRVRIQVSASPDGVVGEKGTRSEVITIVMRGKSDPEAFFGRLWDVLRSRSWEEEAAAVPQASETEGPSRPRMAVVGVSGILRKEQELWESTDKSLHDAFQDLNALMSKAKEMVMLAEKMRQKLLSGPSSNTNANDEEMGSKQEMQDWLLSVGIQSPVTKESAGAMYHQQLSRQVLFTRARAPLSASELRGLVCEDISGGQENFPIPATNVVDDPPFAPTDFVYTKSLQISKSIELPENCTGCQCKGDCVNSRTCACARLNGSDFPYVKQHGGRLIEAKAVVFECGPNCGCNQSCVNRTSQKGLMFHLEVFRTRTKGWAVRSWDTIPSGSPICEYTGILKKTDETEKLQDNSYLFDIDCLQTMKGLDGRTVRPGDVSVLANSDDSDGSEYCIDAGHYGNIARFINHSCQPNLFVQCVLSSHRDIKIAKVMLFAADTIPPLQELTYDYGYILDSVAGPDGNVKKLPCYCGAPDCRKRLY